MNIGFVGLILWLTRLLLLFPLCSETNQCIVNNPCQHGSQCSDTTGEVGYQCNCTALYGGQNCDIGSCCNSLSAGLNCTYRRQPSKIPELHFCNFSGKTKTDFLFWEYVICLKDLHSGSVYDRKGYPITCTTSSSFHSIIWPPVWWNFSGSSDFFPAILL